MADIVFNIAKGRGAELYNRVKTNDPANSALVLVVLAAAGLELDAVLQDYDTLAAILAATNDEATNVNYARKVLTDADLAAMAPDDVNDRMDLDIPDQLFSPGPAAGSNWAKVLICYDGDTTLGTDANIVPITAHDYAITPDGSEILIQVPNGFFRAA